MVDVSNSCKEHEQNREVRQTKVTLRETADFLQRLAWSHDPQPLEASPEHPRFDLEEESDENRTYVVLKLIFPVCDETLFLYFEDDRFAFGFVSNSRETQRKLESQPDLLEAAELSANLQKHLSDGCDECEENESHCEVALEMHFRHLELNEAAIAKARAEKV